MIAVLALNKSVRMCTTIVYQTRVAFFYWRIGIRKRVCNLRGRVLVVGSLPKKHVYTYIFSLTTSVGGSLLTASPDEAPPYLFDLLPPRISLVLIEQSNSSVQHLPYPIHKFRTPARKIYLVLNKNQCKCRWTLHRLLHALVPSNSEHVVRLWERVGGYGKKGHTPRVAI